MGLKYKWDKGMRLKKFFGRAQLEGGKALFREDPDYAKFTFRFYYICLLTSILTPLGFTYLTSNLVDLRILLTSILPLFKGRVEFLLIYSPETLNYYTGSLLALVVLSPLFFVINALAYLKLVSLRGAFSSCNLHVATFVLIFTSMAAFVVHTSFATVDSSFNPKYPGLTKIFFLPAFYFSSSFGIFTATISVFPIFLGLSKITFWAASIVKKKLFRPQSGF